MRERSCGFAPAANGYCACMVLAATATGFPALLIILGVLALLVALGMVIARRGDLARMTALGAVAAIVVGVVLANVT